MIYFHFAWNIQVEMGIDEIRFLYSSREIYSGFCEEYMKNSDIQSESKCLRFEDGKIVYTINPQKENSKLSHFKETLFKFANANTSRLKRYAYQFTIDKNHNLHLFYTTESMIKNNVQNYVQYSFFYHDDPMTPYYSQKLYLNE